VRLRDEEKERETDPLQGGTAAFSSLSSFLLMARTFNAPVLLFAPADDATSTSGWVGDWLTPMHTQLRIFSCLSSA